MTRGEWPNAAVGFLLERDDVAIGVAHPGDLEAAWCRVNAAHCRQLRGSGIVTLAATTPAASGGKALRITPSGTSGTDVDTYAAVGGNGGSMALGMKAGHSYTFSTMIYVPSATGLDTGGQLRVLRAVLYHRASAADPFVQVPSNLPTVADTWVPLRLRASLPVGTTEAFVRPYNGRPSNATTKPVLYDSMSLVEEGIYGLGWVSSTSVNDASSDWTGLTDRGFNVSVTDSDGALTTFAKKPDGTYTATGEDATTDDKLTAVGGGANGPAEFRIGDLDGNTTVFTPAIAFASPAKENAPHTYRIARVIQPGSNQSTTYTYDAEGRATQMLAPLPPGVVLCTTWVAGCKALQFGYDPAGHLTAVSFRTTIATGAELKVDVACYAYDASSGRLLQSWDPRTVSGAGSGTQPVACDLANPVLPTTYTYDATGRLATERAPGLQPWSIGYDSAGRVHTVSRTHNAANGGGTETTTFEYAVPRAADSSNPAFRPDLSTAAKVGAWAQKALPVTATAVFGPSDPASRTDLREATVTTSTPTAAQPTRPNTPALATAPASPPGRSAPSTTSTAIPSANSPRPTAPSPWTPPASCHLTTPRQTSQCGLWRCLRLASTALMARTSPTPTAPSVTSSCPTALSPAPALTPTPTTTRAPSSATLPGTCSTWSPSPTPRPASHRILWRRTSRTNAPPATTTPFPRPTSPG
ncbi:hypothetical protein [Tenggerimyces flavus]|uniref:hypothetical protein n=1 Tax=Tenggerimyces flavus TaxID=1708749 RepID=UPI0036DE4531